MTTPTPNELLPFIILFPAIGALITGLLGRRLSERVAGVVATLAIFSSFSVAAFCWWMMFSDPREGISYAWVLYRWMDAGAGRPLELVHRECGCVATPRLDCDGCGEPLTRQTIRLRPGPPLRRLDRGAGR